MDALHRLEERGIRVMNSPRAIERTVDPEVKKYQLFYWHYDHETHPRLILENPDIPEEEK